MPSNLRINEKFQPLLTSDDRFYILTGGRASGKSYSSTWAILMLSFQKDQSIFYSRKTLSSARTSIIPDFRKVIEEWNFDSAFVVTNDTITNVTTGSTINFIGLQTSSGENTAKMKGLSQATIWVLDEAEELNDEILFDKANFSIRSKRQTNKVILILNPTTKEHFIYERFFVRNGIAPGSNTRKNGVTFIHSTYLDNHDNLDASVIKEMTDLKESNPTRYAHEIMGGWRDRAEGVIFTNWEVAEFQDIGPSYYGLDFGFKDPDAMIEVKIDVDGQRMFVKELIYATGLATTALKQRVIQEVGPGIIIADSANPKIILELQNAGLNVVPSVKGADSIRAGIRMLQDFRLHIDPASHNIIKELNNYVWHDKRSETPVDEFNHTLDALRYATRHLSLPKIIMN